MERVPVDKIRVGCAVIAVMDGRILLGRRGKEPMFGKWIIPGGGIGLFEHYTDTAIREFREETGLTIRVDRIAHVAEIIVPEREHRVIIYVLAEVTGGTMKANSDLLEVKALSRVEVAALAGAGELTPTVHSVLQEIGWLNSDAPFTASFKTKYQTLGSARRATVSGRHRKRGTTRRNLSVGGVQLQLF